MNKMMTIIPCLVLLTGCATMKPTAVSHEYVTPDQQHWSVQISMWSGVPNTPQQTIMIVYNKWSKTPIAVVNGQTKTMSEELSASIIQAVTSFGAAGITGNFMLKAAQADCPVGALCGTFVNVQNQAGAQAGAESNSTQTNNS